MFYSFKLLDCETKTVNQIKVVIFFIYAILCPSFKNKMELSKSRIPLIQYQQCTFAIVIEKDEKI